jgi:hypothetical protein
MKADQKASAVKLRASEIELMNSVTTGLEAPELAVQEQRSSLLGRLAYVLRVHIWLLLFVVVYFAAAVVTSEITGGELILPWDYLRRVLFILGILIPWGIAGYSAYLLWKFRPRRPTAFLVAELSNRFFTMERIVGAVLTLALLFLHATAFSFFKCLIPEIQPFAWDGWLASFDATLHFGSNPWELLHHFFGFAWVTSVIDLSYVLWTIVIPLGMIWFAIGPYGSRLRMQVLLTSVFAWFLLGNFLALAFSSAGPCYYEHVAGTADPFAPLMEYLSHVKAIPIVDERENIYALEIQSKLWNAYTVQNTTFGYGISAMPSMHVGAILLLALAAWQSHRFVGALLFAYTLIILIGSVHLGWHYALDGYVALVGVWAIWSLVGRLLRHDPVIAPDSGPPRNHLSGE